MARLSAKLPDDFISQLESLAVSDELVLDMLDAASPILERNLKNKVEEHNRTGNLSRSIKRAKAKRTSNGAYIAKVRPTGVSREYIDSRGVLRKRKTPVRNAEILAYLEYGTSTQPPRPILSKATNNSFDEVTKAMQDKFNESVKR